MELLDYEKEHIEYLRNNAHECTLFLRRNEEFPIDKPCSLVLVGNGARQTIKGGTGSGDVASRFFKTIEESFKEAGFSITSTEWMDKYDEFRKSTFKDYVKDTKKRAHKHHYLGSVYSMGFFEEEKDYSFDPNYDGDICIYVLSRNSGEGNDRRNIKGDVKLSDRENKDILSLNKKFKKFLLVLNVGGVIDLTGIEEVENILLLSQLGVVTGDTLVDIVLGKANPSGKLTTTWAKPEDYPCFNEFGDLHNTYYKEGIYVGYRYFNTINKNILYPIGYGLSYTDFNIQLTDKSLVDSTLKIKCLVKNIGKLPGKEVVQIYVTKPNEPLVNPFVELCDYKKTKLLNVNEECELDFNIDLSKLGSYDSSRALYVLEKGEYIFRIGNSSLNLEKVCKVLINEEVILERLQNKCVNNSIDEIKLERIKEDNSQLDMFIFDGHIEEKTVTYEKDQYVDPFIKTLSDEELINVCIGHYDSGMAAIVGGSAKNVVGGAGETVLKVKGIKHSLAMADGPAGLRLRQIYGVDEKGTYDVTLDPIMQRMIHFFPWFVKPFILPPKNRHGELHYQYTTAIPIGTALAQSFNDELVMSCGNIVAEEMKIFNVDLWLAPALNIHRNILCGRNFEYYSEDPYVSGRVASMMTKGVETTKGLGVTVKHFACNNQELNRNNNNSQVSERAIREIYLKGFEICIKEAKPKALMTSYNLLNGTHTSESYELVNDILRCEWGYEGLVMTDWIATGRSLCNKVEYPAPRASFNIRAGNDLTMPGCKKDVKDISKALKKGIITRDDLVFSASRIYRSIEKQNN